jgi:hypothetical protein
MQVRDRDGRARSRSLEADDLILTRHDQLNPWESKQIGDNQR